jgi:hypothetical protein
MTPARRIGVRFKGCPNVSGKSRSLARFSVNMGCPPGNSPGGSRRQSIDCLSAPWKPATVTSFCASPTNAVPAGTGSLVVVSDPGGGELTLGEIATLRKRRAAGGEDLLQRQAGPRPGGRVKPCGPMPCRSWTRWRPSWKRTPKRLDDRIDLVITQDMTSIVRDRLQMLVRNGIMGLALVVLVLGLFFRPRLALWAVLGLPAAFMGAFLVMTLTGLSLNMITLVALLMTIGIVMDDAIVITDNIAAQLLRSGSPSTPWSTAPRQVLPGVLSSFITTVACSFRSRFWPGSSAPFSRSCRWS